MMRNPAFRFETPHVTYRKRVYQVLTILTALLAGGFLLSVFDLPDPLGTLAYAQSAGGGRQPTLGNVAPALKRFADKLENVATVVKYGAFVYAGICVVIAGIKHANGDPQAWARTKSTVIGCVFILFSAEIMTWIST